jgi:hypothetical protein
MSNFLFCFLRESKRAPAINQYRHVLICEKLGCGYLNLSGESPTCDCLPTTEYFLAFQDVKKKRKTEAATEEDHIDNGGDDAA